jgi:hypothetical protein
MLRVTSEEVENDSQAMYQDWEAELSAELNQKNEVLTIGEASECLRGGIRVSG